MAYRLHVGGINNVLEKNSASAFSHFASTDKVEVLAAYTAFFGLVAS
jgi:hypothetical protein